MAFTKILGPGIHTLANFHSHNINSSGIITATKFVGDMEPGGGSGTFDSLTVTGNLGVGGTVTYTDVTNVDAVGIITAQSGVYIGAGATVGSFNTTTGISSFKKLNVDETSTFNGSVGIADSIIHLGNTDTSIRFPSDDTFAVETAGSEALRIDSNGRLGINENSPDRDLHISNTTPYIRVESTSANQPATLELYHTRGNGSDKWPVSVATDDAALTFNVAAAANGSPAEKLRIDSSGRVGIGTENPSEIFHITKYDTTGPSITLQNSANKVWINNWGSGAASGRTNRLEINAALTSSLALAAPYISLQTGGTGDAYERLRIDSSGDVSIGNGAGYAVWNNTGNDQRPRFQLKQTGGDDRGVVFLEERGDANGMDVFISKSRGGSGAGAITSGDTLGFLKWSGGDGTRQHNAAGIQVWNNGTIATGRVAGNMSFYTAPDSVAGVSERLRITSTGEILLSNSSNYFLSFDRTNASTGTGDFNINIESNSQVSFSYDDEGSIVFGTATAPRTQAGFSEKLRIDASGNVLIGDSAGQIGKLSTLGTGNHISAIRHSTDTSSANFIFAKYRGSRSSPAIIVNGDMIGDLAWYGYNGSSIIKAASVSASASSTVDGSNMPTDLIFKTTYGNTNYERLRIASTGIVSIGGLAPNIAAGKGLEISNSATTEIRLKNSSGGSGQADGFAIQKWSNGNNYIYDYDAQNILFGTTNLSRAQLTKEGRVVISPDGSVINGANSAFSVHIVHAGNYSYGGSTTGTYPGVHIKSTSSGGGNGVAIWTPDSNWGLYTSAGNKTGLAIGPNTNSASSGDAKFFLTQDGHMTTGPDVLDQIDNAAKNKAAASVAGGGLHLAGHNLQNAAGKDHRRCLNWYVVAESTGDVYHHLVTSLWGGGSPSGNTSHIMGGFTIKGYSYGGTYSGIANDNGLSNEDIYFHNWSGAMHGYERYYYGSGWDPGNAAYVNSSGWVTLRLKAGRYVCYNIDLYQFAVYDVRDIYVTTHSMSGSTTI